MMRQLADNVIKKDRKLHAVFVGLEKAYLRQGRYGGAVGILGDMMSFDVLGAINREECVRVDSDCQNGLS